MARPRPTRLRILVICTDAYGGRGGIARYVRDLLCGLCAYGDSDVEVHAIPRNLADAPEAMPANLRFHVAGARGRGGFVAATLAAWRQAGRFDLVVCGHVLLIPAAYLVARVSRCPLVLFAYGIEVWQAPQSRVRRALARRVDALVSISQVTADRMQAWSRRPDMGCHLLPPCIDTQEFGPGPRRPDLVARYGLAGKRVLLTMARLDAREHYKGIDEIIGVLPDLCQTFPDLVYLIVGDGDDRARLERQAQAAGVADRTVFAGWIADDQKVAHYRLADAFAMPGCGEGFGIVFLEAMACGVPVLASSLDGSREAVRQGDLGAVVDPRDPQALRQALADVLGRPAGTVPAGLAYFSAARFRERLHGILDAVLARPGGAPAERGT